MAPWRAPGHGVLLAGDHRLGAEVAPLFSLFGQLSRHDFHVVAKPYSLTARLLSSACGADTPILPVIPKTLTRSSSQIWNRDLGWRIARANRLPTVLEADKLNNSTLQKAAELLAGGRAVTVFPAGGVVDGFYRPWRSGVSNVMLRIPKFCRDSVAVALFRFDDFSPGQLLRSLVLQSYGISPTPMQITLRVADAISVTDMMNGEEEADAARLTHALQRRFWQTFDTTS